MYELDIYAREEDIINTIQSAMGDDVQVSTTLSQNTPTFPLIATDLTETDYDFACNGDKLSIDLELTLKLWYDNKPAIIEATKTVVFALEEIGFTIGAGGYGVCVIDNQNAKIYRELSFNIRFNKSTNKFERSTI